MFFLHGTNNYQKYSIDLIEGYREGFKNFDQNYLYRDKYNRFDTQKSDFFQIISFPANFTKEEFKVYLDGVEYFKKKVKTKKYFSSCDDNLNCKISSELMFEKFPKKRFAILFDSKNKSLNIFLLKVEPENNFKNREIGDFQNENLTYLKIYSELNSNFKFSLQSQYPSKNKSLEKTNLRIILDYFNGKNSNEIASKSLEIFNLSFNVGDNFVNRNIMFEEFSKVDGILYKGVFLTSKIKKLEIEYKKYKENLSQKNGDLENRFFTEILENFDTPFEILIAKYIKKTYVFQTLNKFDDDYNKLLLDRLVRYENFDKSEGEVSKLIRLSILISSYEGIGLN